MRVILAALVAMLLAASAGCGESGSPGEASSVVPEDVAAYVSVDTSFAGEQWRAASDLLARFPDGENALDELLAEAELQDALGPETVFAVLPGPVAEGREPPVVMLTQPDEPAAFDRLVEESDAVACGGAGLAGRRPRRACARPLPRGARGAVARGLGRLRGGHGRRARGRAGASVRERRGARRVAAGASRRARSGAARAGRRGGRDDRGFAPRRGRRPPGRGPSGSHR